MFARNTDRDWEALGEHAPYWGVLTHPDYLGETLSGAARENFFATGGHDVARFRGVLEQRLGASPQIGRALDFGCGVGRLLLPMRQRSGFAAGVDVAAGMRARTVQHLAEAGLADTPVLASLDEARAHGPFDWVNTYIVLQHVPPARGYGLIRELAGMVAPGGAVSLHVTAAREPRLAPPRFAEGPLRALHWRVRNLSSPAGVITMFDYDLRRVLTILGRAGLGRFVLEHEDHGGHHGFIIYGRKL